MPHPKNQAAATVAKGNHVVALVHRVQATLKADVPHQQARKKPANASATNQRAAQHKAKGSPTGAAFFNKVKLPDPTGGWKALVIDTLHLLYKYRWVAP